MEEVSPKKLHRHSFNEMLIASGDYFCSDLREIKSKETTSYGEIRATDIHFDGIRILHTRHIYNGRYLFDKKNHSDIVGMEFNLKGNYTIHHMGITYSVRNNQHNIVYSPFTGNTFENIDLETETFKIEFVPEVFLNLTRDGNDILTRFAGNVALGKTTVISPSSGHIDAKIKLLIHEILTCPYSGGLKKIFLLSKSMELMVLQAESLQSMQTPHKKADLKKGDLDKLYFARDYISKRLDMPPSLSELSKIAGLNEYKLKRGFKDVFNTTVFGYISDCRLTSARATLVENQKSVSEIAYELGYSSPQHFSNAFKKKFGVIPTMFKK